MDAIKKKNLLDMAKTIRKKIIEAANSGNGNAHLGASLSIVEIMAVLYEEFLKYDKNNLEWEDRDRFFLSKGHGALGFYSTLEAMGIISPQDLASFQQDFGDFSSHPVMKLSKGIESSNGSLGHGLSLAIGSLFAARKKKKNYFAYVLLGNGECNEGSVWEAIMAAAQYKLNHLIAVVDNNSMQSDGESEYIIHIPNMNKRFQSFGWNVIEISGNEIEEVYTAFEHAKTNAESGDKPTVIIANTTKGNGISFMENNKEWHHKRMTDEQYQSALKELAV
jgi:transketolase